MKNSPKLTSKKLELLFKEHYTFLCLISLAIVKDKDIAKDVVQDFFVSFWERRECTIIKTTFKSYAVKAVKNLSLLSLEKVKKDQSLIKTIFTEEYYEQEAWDLPKKNEKINLLLNKLPESRRNIFVSSVIYGQSYSDIAEANGISINTVKTQIKRAYAFLRANTTEDMLYFISLLPFLQ